MHALVTGAGGFLGRYIVEQLVDRGDRVRGFARGNYPEVSALGVELIQGDIRDAAAVEAACRGIDVVFHVAAVAGIWGPWHHFYDVNTQGTINVLQGCRRAGVPRFVLTSSPSVTFAGRDQCGVSEITAAIPRKWLAHYPFTKASPSTPYAFGGHNGLDLQPRPQSGGRATSTSSRGSWTHS
jgi:nucleoside-diphosphate-sugar epimerase